MPMKCHQVRDELLAKLKNEISEELSNEIEQHLALCSDCRREEEKIKKTLAAVHYIEDYVPSSDSWERLEGAIKCLTREKERQEAGKFKVTSVPVYPRTGFLGKALFVIALLAIIGGIAAYLLRAPEMVGQIIGSKGSSFVITDKDQRGVYENLRLLSGQELRTLDESSLSAKLVLPGRITLLEKSSMSLKSPSLASLDRGQLQIEVSDGDKHFKVLTIFGEITVTGGGAAEITVSSDRVEVMSKNGRSIISHRDKDVELTKGYYSYATLHQPPAAPSPKGIIAKKAELKATLTLSKKELAIDPLIATLRLENTSSFNIMIYRYSDNEDHYMLHFKSQDDLHATLRGTGVKEKSLPEDSKFATTILKPKQVYELRCNLQNLNFIQSLMKAHKKAMISFTYSGSPVTAYPEVTNVDCTSEEVEIDFSSAPTPAPVE